MMTKVTVVWFRRDLRIKDNLALENGNKKNKILPVYILDNGAPAKQKQGSFSQTWLYKSLESLDESLLGNLHIFPGNAEESFKTILKKYDVAEVTWNQSFEKYSLKEEQKIIKFLDKQEIPYQQGNSSYLFHPRDILKDDETYYKVFSAYKRKAFSFGVTKAKTKKTPLSFVEKPRKKNQLNNFKKELINKEAETVYEKHWEAGEKTALKKTKQFISKHLSGYKKNRNIPSAKATSLLSPHLHFGEISPRVIWNLVMESKATGVDKEAFLIELIWRDYSAYLLYHVPNIYKDNCNQKFDNFPWTKNKKFLDAWKSGKTGYPIIDAGMRQLAQTGYMHNRVRMIVASFLIKNLLIDWRVGRDFFWESLFDADIGNNSVSWQWVAGTGIDPSPYFRIFNPTRQAEQYDPDGKYIKQFVPELESLNKKQIFEPWNLSPIELEAQGITLGEDYPHPIADLKETREAALEIFKNLT